MTSKLIPNDPAAVTVIRTITPNIITSSAPFARHGLLKVGGRGTIVRLTNGALAVFSPTALIPAVRTAVESLGNNVQYLVALDIEHHIYLSDWAKAYPGAKVLGPDGLPEKRETNPATKGVPFHVVWTEKNKADVRVDPAFDADFDYEYVGSHPNRELVFNYRPERTLIQADLIFNLPATEQYSRTGESPRAGLLTKLFVALFGTAPGSGPRQRRVIWYTVSRPDREGYTQSVRRIGTWDFDRIIPCHGDVIETGGKGIFRTIMEWHLEQKK